MRGRALAAALTMSATLSFEAWAQPDDADALALTWHAPAGCPDEGALRKRVRDLLGNTEEARDRVRVEARVEERGDGWMLHITTELRGAAGQRDVEATTCETLADTAALIIALAIDPEAVARTSGNASPAEPPPSAPAELEALPPAPLELAVSFPPPSPALVPSPPPDLAEEEPASSRFTVSALVQTDLGSLPAAALGIGGRLGFHHPLGGGLRMGALLGGTFFLGQREPLGDDPTLGGDFDFFAFSAQACPGYELDPVEVAFCLGLEIGRMGAAGYGVDLPETRRVVWLALPFGVTGAYRIVDPLAVRLDLGAAVPFGRPRWTLTGIGEVDRPAVIAARAGLGLELQL